MTTEDYKEASRKLDLFLLDPKLQCKHEWTFDTRGVHTIIWDCLKCGGKWHQREH